MNKIFRHNLVEPKKLRQTVIDNKRYYVLPDGVTKFKSVTTVISEKKDKTKLLEWRKRVGEKEANKVSAIANSRGTAVHKMAERYVMNRPDYDKGAMPVNLETFGIIKKVLDERVDDIYGIELPLYSKALKAAGTADQASKFDGIDSIIDFKTSRKPKKESWIEDYFIQVATYGMMFSYLYDIPIQQGVIIMAVDDEPEPQIFIKNIGEYSNKVIQTFMQ